LITAYALAQEVTGRRLAVHDRLYILTMSTLLNNKRVSLQSYWIQLHLFLFVIFNVCVALAQILNITLHI